MSSNFIHEDSPEPHYLKLSEIWNAGSTWEEAFQDDPLVNYTRDNRKSTFFQRFITRLVYRIVIRLWWRNDLVLSVNDGSAILVSRLVGPKPVIPRLKDLFLRSVISFVALFRTRDEKKRTKEAEDKMDKASKEVLGDRVDDMIYVSLVATSPASQGRGYGSALLKEVTIIADQKGQAAWLKSSNIRNTPFYNSQGFQTVATTAIGEDNPDWHQDPVIVSIMVREPAGRHKANEEKK